MLYSVGDVIHYTSANRPDTAIIKITAVHTTQQSYETEEFCLIDCAYGYGSVYDEWYLHDKCTIHGVYKSIAEFKDLNPEFFI